MVQQSKPSKELNVAIFKAMADGNIGPLVRKLKKEHATDVPQKTPASPNPFQKCTKIVPLTDNCERYIQRDYLQARWHVAALGKTLPSHVLHDDYLVQTENWKSIQGLYPAWAREIIVHPEKNGTFRKGQDRGRICDMAEWHRYTMVLIESKNFRKSFQLQTGMG